MIVTAVGVLSIIVFRDTGDREAKVIRVDLIQLIPAPDQHDDYLDNLPPPRREGERFVLPATRITFDAAIQEFKRQFPAGFEDSRYIGDLRSGERLYKWRAHETWVSSLGGAQLRALLGSDLREAVRRALHCVGQVNLLFTTESAALRDDIQSFLYVAGRGAAYGSE